MKKINWAILGPGKIAEKFAIALEGVESSHLYCVASRDNNRAAAFAEKFNFETYSASYEALIADPQVDVIYIASPHTFHAEQSIACLQAGKAVLCEKPMTINAEQASLVFDAAVQNNAFYMEAVWTRCMPMLEQVRQWIDAGTIGEVKLVQANFGINIPFKKEHRLYNLDLAGGALLDLGIYPITLAQCLMQKLPSKISALADIGPSGVDERVGVLLKYADGAIANLSAAVNTRTNYDAWIHGTKGRIQLLNFWRSEEATLIIDDQSETVTIPHRVNGYEYEIEEVNRCLNEGLVESPRMSWNDSLMVMQIMDEIRAQIDLPYPMEATPSGHDPIAQKFH